MKLRQLAIAAFLLLSSVSAGIAQTNPSAVSSAKKVTVTLVRWPYT